MNVMGQERMYYIYHPNRELHFFQRESLAMVLAVLLWRGALKARRRRDIIRPKQQRITEVL